MLTCNNTQKAQANDSHSNLNHFQCVSVLYLCIWYNLLVYAPPIRPRLMALYKCALIDWFALFNTLTAATILGPTQLPLSIPKLLH